MKQPDGSRIITYPESPHERDLSCRYGRAVRLLTSASVRRNETLRQVGVHLWPAVRLDQIAFLYDSSGAAVAFASWAFVTDRVAAVLLADRTYELDISEWNEGDQLWLIDFFAPYGDAWNLYRVLRRRWLRQVTRVRAVRYYIDRRTQRCVDIRVRSTRGQGRPADLVRSA